jgi:hypothetical protein
MKFQRLRPGQRVQKTGLIIFGWLFLFYLPVLSQNSPCHFNAQNLQFSGDPVEQARCLLRPVKPRGILAEPLKNLPPPLEKLIGRRVRPTRKKLRKYLQKLGLDEQALGGSLAEPLSMARLPNGEQIPALYFIIHDTSTPNYGKESFPADINDAAWKYNNLEMWLKNPVAHVFVNRVGDSVTTSPFNETVRKGWGTKFARDFLKADGKGLQIHIELCQPRRSSSDWFDGNDEISPEIGFTEEQYQRVALLYLAAGVRRGTWLIPAYHCAIDAGIKDAHDDPQNFKLENFAGALKTLIDKL